MTATFACAKARAAARPLGAIDHCVPLYLAVHYWWAYVHPNAVKLFERQWLVNLILWGNYARLRDAALTELGDRLSGRTLQVACVYGDLTSRLGRQAASGGRCGRCRQRPPHPAQESARETCNGRTGALVGNGFHRSQTSGRQL